jgi:parvulin-like peptidyl-prolyl isomerase
LCDDATFLRRVYLDVIGVIPTATETNRFLASAANQAKREKLEDILKKARAGEDFAVLLKYSEDPTLKDNNGELTLTREGRFLEFEAAAFSLGPNQVSDIIVTPFGFHIVKLMEKIPAKRTPLEDVSKNIKQKLEDDEVKKQMPDYFEKMYKEYSVEILYKPPGVGASSSTGAK